MRRMVVSSLFPQISATSYRFTVGTPQVSRTASAYSAVPCWMQRSRMTSTPRSGLRSSGRTSSRSSMILVSTRRDSSSARRSFSSTRTRESNTPTRGPGGEAPRSLFTPVLFRLGSQRERRRRGLLHLKLRAAVGARDDLALHGLGSDDDVGIALGALRHAFPLFGHSLRSA